MLMTVQFSLFVLSFQYKQLGMGPRAGLFESRAHKFNDDLTTLKTQLRLEDC